jgi:NADPH:quinone reductase-like Zn-dependent oxidoreductase
MPWTHIRLKAFGGPENLVLETVAELPETGPGELRIRVPITSAAFTDVMIRKGMYPDVKDKPPFIPGYDIVGIVASAAPARPASAPATGSRT